MIRTPTLALSLALAACIGAAHATPAPQANPAPRAQEDADFARARADLARAAARMAELARERAGSRALNSAYAAAAARPVLGVVLTADGGPGAHVTGVTPGSAAAEAGLRSGDRLLSINDSPIPGSTGELRVRNARTLVRALEAGKPATISYRRGDSEHVAEVTPTMRSRLMAFDRAELAELLDDTRLAALRDGSLQAITDSVRVDGDEIKREITRALDAAGLRNCPGEGCRAPVLMSALRWSGLNLASVDEKLGRYFGTDRGVLVLSSGGLEGLEPGDVILEIDGTSVADPRDVMSALRDQPASARVTVAYLRDRNPASVQVAVPKLRTLDLPAPPAPPAAPAPPESPAPAPPRAPRPA